MDFFTMLMPLLGLSFVIERVMESAFNVVEQIPVVKAWKAPHVASDATDDLKAKAAAKAASYTSWKQILTFGLGIAVGIYFANLLQIPLVSISITAEPPAQPPPIVSNYDFSGAVAGAISPFAHQILESLLNFQKLLEQQKKHIAEGGPNG